MCYTLYYYQTMRLKSTRRSTNSGIPALLLKRGGGTPQTYRLILRYKNPVGLSRELIPSVGEGVGGYTLIIMLRYIDPSSQGSGGKGVRGEGQVVRRSFVSDMKKCKDHIHGKYRR